MTTADLQPVTEITLTEMVESLTGFDEIAIAKHFDGLDPYADARTKTIMLSRALVFVALRRGTSPMTDHAARESVMDMPMKRVTSWFSEDSADDELAEELGDAPVTPAGEGVGPDA